MNPVVTSAPAKVILFGEYGVNQQQEALVTAVDLRTCCRVTPRPDTVYSFSSGAHHHRAELSDLLALKVEIDRLRRRGDLEGIRAHCCQDFFAPSRYVLAHIVERNGGLGLDIEWRSSLPIGSGFGSGAAATSSLALAVYTAIGQAATPQEIAFLAWQGDIVAHGGVASALDSSGCAIGGLIRYSLADGPQPLSHIQTTIPMVIGDTLVQSITAEMSAKAWSWLAAHPGRQHLFLEMGMLAQLALTALQARDFATLGHLMNLNQLLLEKLGASCLEIEQLIEAALEAGALGAKLSGSGGGGIIIALTGPDKQAAVAEAIETAGGRSYIVTAGSEGVRVEPNTAWERVK